MKKLFVYISITLGLLLADTRTALPAILINEFMASNSRTYPDITDFEDYPDWIELKNLSNAPMALDRYFLSDDSSNPFKWQIPATASIPANGFIVFVADGHDAAPGETFPRGYWPWKDFVTEKFHTSFSLSSVGESITLIQATGLSSVPLVNASRPAPMPPETVAVWRYKDDGSDQSTQWRAQNFDDAAWASGPSELGYGDTQATTLSYGTSSVNKHITTYFRHRFSVANPAVYHGLTMKLLVDDGCVVYLNGAEVARRNMPAGEINYKTQATTAVGGADETAFFNYSIPASLLTAGENVIAVEVHQDSPASSDISFDLSLTAHTHTGYSVIDTISFGQQVSDISYGRDAGNPALWKHFAEPSPGKENSTGVVDDIRVEGSEVTISPPGGIYGSDQAVTLSSPAGVIHYTLDGSDPKSTSPFYSEPIRISTTTVVRARSFQAGKAPGPIVTRTYFRGETPGDLPYISVVADPETLFGSTIGIYSNQHETVTGSYGERDVYKGKDAPGNVEYFAPDGTGFSAGCGIRIGGENNWVHPQKALNLRVQSKYGSDEISYDLFPGSRVPVHTSFTLRDGGDNWNKDMLRDCLFPRLAAGYLNVDTADYRPSIVFVNGVYYGLHDLRPRWDATWFAQKYHLPDDKVDHLLYGHVTSSSVTLGVDKGTTADWLALLEFVQGADLTAATNWAYVESKIDIDSLIDFVVAESYGNNTSWRHNREFWKEKNPGGRWRWFLTDMDRTFFTSTLSGVLSEMLSTDELLIRLKTNEPFKARLAQRYAAHLAGTFKPSRVHSVLSQMDAEVSAFVPRHVARWAPDGTTEAIRSSHIQQIKEYATQRAANFAGELAAQLGVGAPVEVTLAVNDASQGSVLVQGVPVEASTFKIFPNLPFTLKAVPAPGYKFGGWTGAAGGESIELTLSSAATITARFEPSGETVIGGTLARNTVLTSADSSYTLSSDLIIPAGLSLTVEAGVTIEMPEFRNIRVQGRLEIAGSAAQPVNISGRNGARWGGISFEDPSDPSHLAHLVIRGATKGYDPIIYSSAITGHNADVTMDFLDIDHSESPVYIRGGSCTLRDSKLRNPYTGDAAHVKKAVGIIQRCIFLGNNAPDTDAIDFDGVTNGLIEDCRIYHFQGSNSDGIDIGEGTSNLLVQGNAIYFNSDKGVSVGQGSSATLRENLIVGCNLGVGVKDAGSSAILDQNTFVSCNVGVAVYEKNFGDGGGSVTVNNTIFSKATTAPVTVDGFSTLALSYCLSDTVPLPGMNNLLADPLFADPAVLNFQLQAMSPAINGGDPAHAPDPDNTRVDIGAAYSYLAADYPYTISQTVVINEILANSGASSDWIELHNRTQSPIEIGGWFLSDSATDLQKYRIPPGTIIPARGYVVFYENAHFGPASIDTNKVTAFALSDVGEKVYLSSAVDDQLTDYRTREEYGPSMEGETLGMFYKPSSDSYNFIAMRTPTPGAPNSAPRVGPIVISEIMYNPAGSGTGDAEYIELLNISDEPVTLYDAVKGKPWRINDGIEFELPTNPPLTIAPGERVVIAKNMTLFNAVFGASLPADIKLLQWTAGSLNNGGETLQLDRPGAVDALNVLQYVRQDRVNFSDSVPWPVTPDGRGPSLTKILEGAYGNDYFNWMAAAASPGASSLLSPPDSDQDGLPDVYEVANGFDPYDVTDASLDPDLDGQSNLAEYKAGTNPHEPNNNLTLTFVNNPEHGVVEFTAVSGKSYLFQYKTSLTDPTWQTLSRVTAGSLTSAMQVMDPEARTNTQRFYRVILESAGF